MNQTYVKFYKSGDNMGIETNARTEDEFMKWYVIGLSSIIAKDMYKNDWEFQINVWTRQMVEIVCKLRGYKSMVSEKTILEIGHTKSCELAYDTNDVKVVI